MFYGAVVWDPWLIAAQIVLLQCLFYLSLGVFTGILVGTRVSRMSLVYFFDYATVTASTVTGWCVVGSFLLSSLAAAVYMPFLIERAKKCLDFAATLYIIHLFICILYGGWPSSMTWWVVNGTGMAVMALLGEYLCIRRELREIPITRYRSSANLSPVFESQDTREAGLIHEMFEPASAVQWAREKKSKELRVLGRVAAQLKEIVPKLLLLPFRKMSFLLWVIGF